MTATANGIDPVPLTTFASVGLKERGDLQRLLRTNIEIVSPDTLVLSEEFGSWNASARRIDLLGIDRNANLVVVELKRDETGAHMELQALRYAAMVARMTFEQAVDALHAYQTRLHAAAATMRTDRQTDITTAPTKEDARGTLLKFLEWTEPEESAFAQEVRIVLVAADFSRELTTSVMWLNERDLDITCVQMRPYKLGDRLLLQIEQVIPLKEASEYQVQVREKARQERGSTTVSTKDWTRYDLQIGDVRFHRLPKRRFIFEVIRHAVKSHGIKLSQLAEVLVSSRPWIVVDGVHDAAGFRSAVQADTEAGGIRFDLNRFLCNDDELLVEDGRTFAITKMWGTNTLPSIAAIRSAFPQVRFEYQANETD